MNVNIFYHELLILNTLYLCRIFFLLYICVYFYAGIRTFLLESEEHECPDCSEKDISPETLIPNRFLRNAVMNFKNETGYAKRQTYRPPVQSAGQPVAPVDQPKVTETQQTNVGQVSSQTTQASTTSNAPSQETAETPQQLAESESAAQQVPTTSSLPQQTSSSKCFPITFVPMYINIFISEINRSLSNIILGNTTICIRINDAIETDVFCI